MFLLRNNVIKIKKKKNGRPFKSTYKLKIIKLYNYKIMHKSINTYQSVHIF